MDKEIEEFDVKEFDRLKAQLKLLSNDNVLKIIAELATAEGRTLRLQELGHKCGIAYTTTRQLVWMMKDAKMVDVGYVNPKDKRAGLEVTLLDFEIRLTLTPSNIVYMIKGIKLPREL